MNDFVDKVRAAGVVGAGGAGFPTYVKVDASVDTVLCNGAECEPLLNKDQMMMQHYAEKVIVGMKLVMANAGAERGIIGVKSKNAKSIEALSSMLPADITIFQMSNQYPAGDEYELVYQATGRLIPAQGLPMQVGCIVQNPETLYNIANAVEGKAVTHSLVTIHGDVAKPVTVWAPLGMTYGELIDAAGGALVDDFVMVDGGPMMGPVIDDVMTRVTRLSSGIIVLPRDNNFVARKLAPEAEYRRIGKSACDQCSDCTEMCPRYLMGYPIKPHLVMRSLLTSGEMSESLAVWAQACCGCNICTFWACPEGLDPRNICQTTARDLREQGRWLPPEELQKLQVEPHPMREYRAVPADRLARRLTLGRFMKTYAEFIEQPLAASTVIIPLQQHIGAPPTPVVSVGDRVTVGQKIAEEAATSLSVPVHASICGKVVSIDNGSIEIEGGK
ncbi:Ion-translocating oxidoreductase complex subunit C [Sinobacterium norvegicum]|uniref:Ion-translocating oxidoreductase complex subunit C n=1 Tax=Sinobacterium norvegicum TaxID=1641715 RepID=A0ABN8EFF5_9GAMM|nr:4Fe-4S dicluster domain-containing protein [Sinobacterium norvegicum]CAH0990430.1 Ion-translocating oxidoreductase complex subunit C [Sinobacterium norvegicum]